MHKHRLTRGLLVFIALTLTLAGMNVGVASGAAQGTDRPFKSSGSATVTVDLTQGLAISIDGTLKATHMGKSTWSAVVGEPDLGDVVTVPYESTITAANGDTVTTEAIGVIDLTTFTFSATETITGGTGRFAHASGSYTLSGTIDPLTVVDDGSGIINIPLPFSATGTISY